MKKTILTEEERTEMYRLWKLEQVGMKELAERFRVKEWNVRNSIDKKIKEDIEARRQRREQVDEQLRIIATMKCNTGIDSTPEELAEVRRKEKECVDIIKKIDPEFFITIQPDEI